MGLSTLYLVDNLTVDNVVLIFELYDKIQFKSCILGYVAYFSPGFSRSVFNELVG